VNTLYRILDQFFRPDSLRDELISYLIELQELEFGKLHPGYATA